MRKVLVVLLALAILPVLSYAQIKGGDIYGSVVLADGSKVPGVLITLTGDKIGKLTTISSEKGNFRFLSLPPGMYELKCELEGFKTVIRKDIDISLGKSVTLNILMETTTLKEEVLVTGRTGIVDTRKTDIAATVDKQWIESIPTARNPWTVLSALPGMMVDRVDVGGADSGQQSIFYAGGGTSDDTTWNVDGANITDPSAIGSAPAYLNINAYDELQVNLGANDITAQTGGIQLNFVTKRAGNKITGDFHLYVEDKAWEMTQTPTDYMVQRDWVVPGINRLYQYGVSLGGPIVKDKVWWFGSWAIQDIHKRTEPGTEDATWLTSGYGKLNFQVGNTSGDFHISYDNKQKWGRTSWGAAQQNDGSLWDQSGPGYLFYGGLSHVMGNLMLNIKAVYTDGGFTLDPRGADINPATGHNEGADTIILDQSYAYDSMLHYTTNRNSIDASFDGNYFLEGALGGDHEIRFGVDYFTADTTSMTLFANQRYCYVYTGYEQYNWFFAIPDFKTDVNFQRISAYIQDTITWGKLTASFGVRYDKETGGINPLTQPAFTWYEPGSPHNGEVLWPDWNTAINIQDPYKPDVAWSLISPRISFTYDITGDGKNVVKLSAAQYMGQSGNTIGGSLAPFRLAGVNWNDANKDNIPQYTELGSVWYNAPFFSQNPTTNLNNVTWDPDYNTPLLTELVLKFEKAVTDDLAFELSGFYKKRTKLSVDYANSGRFGNTTKRMLDLNGTVEDKSNWEYAGDVMVGGTMVPTYERIDNGIGNFYYNKEKAYDTYLGLQFVINKKLANKWMANLSFTYQDWKRHRFADEELDLNNFDFFNGGQMAESTSGSGLTDIFVNSKWMVKLTGMYQLPYGINLTTFFQARQGNPQPLRSSVSLNQGSVWLFMGEGNKLGDQRLPTFWMLNLGLEKTFKVADTVTATLAIDWYNATNNQIELKQNLYVGATIDPGEPQPTMWTNAGLFQFGVRVNF
jgi:hypothetical protein